MWSAHCCWSWETGDAQSNHHHLHQHRQHQPHHRRHAQVLVAHGANLGVADQQGDSAVYWAARQGHAPVIR